MKGGTNLCDYTISEVFHYITIACVQLSLVVFQGKGLDCNGGSECQKCPELHDAGCGGRYQGTERVKRTTSR
jgi:hypothetical protein